MTAAEIKSKYGLPSYRTWEQVPKNLFTKTAAWKVLQIKIPADAKPAAVKNSSGPYAKERIFFLYDITPYKEPEDEILESYRTDCCHVKPKRLGRAHCVCGKCGRDVTLEMVLIYEAIKKHQ